MPVKGYTLQVFAGRLHPLSRESYLLCHKCGRLQPLSRESYLLGHKCGRLQPLSRESYLLCHTCWPLTAFEQEELSFVAYMLRHGTSVYTISSEHRLVQQARTGCKEQTCLSTFGLKKVLFYYCFYF